MGNVKSSVYYQLHAPAYVLSTLASHLDLGLRVIISPSIRHLVSVYQKAESKADFCSYAAT